MANRGFIEYALDLLGEDLTATDMGNFQETEYFLVHNLKKRCKKRDFKGIHDRFLRDHVFRGRMIENSRDEEICRAWDVLADEDHTYDMSEEEYFYYKNNWWISLNKSGTDTQPLRKRSDFKHVFVYIKTFTPRSWRTTTLAHTVLEVQTMETSIEFFPLLGGNGKNPDGLPENSQKVKKEEASKGL